MKNINRAGAVLLAALTVIYSCKKAPSNPVKGDDNTTTIPTSTGNTPTTIVSPTDPDVATTQGFFLNNPWLPKTLVDPTMQDLLKPTATEGIVVSLGFE